MGRRNIEEIGAYMDTTEIGYISKTHGLKGQIVLRLNEFINIDSEAITSLFLNMDVDGENMIINQTYVGNSGYIVPHTSYFLLNKILNILKNGNNGVLLADEE
jgi:hypothetical protein